MVGENVSDADKKNVFLDGLSEHFATIVTMLRNNNDDYNSTHQKVLAHAKKENLLDVRDKGIPQFKGTNFLTESSGHQGHQTSAEKTTTTSAGQEVPKGQRYKLLRWQSVWIEQKKSSRRLTEAQRKLLQLWRGRTLRGEV